MSLATNYANKPGHRLLVFRQALVQSVIPAKQVYGLSLKSRT
jgi:hypothetical protein